MSIAERSQKSQDEQSHRVRSYKPDKPEIPTDGRCADATCNAQMPPHPTGSFNEQFTNVDASWTWLATVTSATALFALITIFARA